MKLIKKSLILASTVALGLAITGCSKKNNLLKGVKAYSLDTNPNKYSTSAVKGSIEGVRTYQTMGNRYIKYTTAQGKTAVYDYKAEKEIFSTEESVYSIYLYSDVILLVTYLDDSQEMLFIDGTTIYGRGAYDNIFAGNIETKYNYKIDNYQEIIAYTYNDEPGKDIEFTYYSITFKGKKNEDKTIVKDMNSMTIKTLNASDVKKYNVGDKVIKDGNYYSQYRTGSTLVYYNQASKRPSICLTFDGAYTSIISKDKALLQVYKTLTAGSEYTVEEDDNYYDVDTYLIDLKAGTYKRLTKFNYFLNGYESNNYTDNYFCFTNVGKIVDKSVICYNDITVSVKDGSICDDQDFAYSDDFIDLKNGYYLTSYSGKVYFTNTNGEIKKVFDGTYSIYPLGKVIAIYFNNKYRFVDYKGNYIDEELKVSTKVDITLDSFYYIPMDDPNGNGHIVKFANGKKVSDEEVTYNVSDSSINFEDIRTNTRYINESNYYIVATSVTTDTYGDTTLCTIELRNIETDELIGTVENITDYQRSLSFSDDDKSALYYFTKGTVDSMTNSYTLTIYEFK